MTTTTKQTTMLDQKSTVATYASAPKQAFGFEAPVPDKCTIKIKRMEVFNNTDTVIVYCESTDSLPRCWFIGTLTEYSVLLSTFNGCSEKYVREMAYELLTTGKVRNWLTGEYKTLAEAQA